jgi:hypothetical protein
MLTQLVSLCRRPRRPTTHIVARAHTESGWGSAVPAHVLSFNSHDDTSSSFVDTPESNAEVMDEDELGWDAG